MTHRPPTALEILRAGNARFAAGESVNDHYSPEVREASLHGQQPWAVVVGCSDSRVPVESIFDVGPGELFVVRTAGHVLAAASVASIRYAVEKLGARLVVVLGHEDCGAVTAALEGDAPEWLAPIVSRIDVSKADASRAPDDADEENALLAAAVDEHVRDTVAELRDWAEELPLDGDPPMVVGAAYKLASGKVHWLD